MVELTRGALNPIRLVILLFLLVTAFAMKAFLKLYLSFRSPQGSTLHSKAVDNIDLFLKQYPFHLYPIVCKCLELAYLQSQLPALLKNRKRVLEMAIGEGSFSSLIFTPDAEIVGLELNPYYLQKVRQMKHVQEAIVCDCLEPPIREGSFDLVIANNFLHHVTKKTKLLATWSRIAEKAVFNENTVFWASGWVTPYILAKLGLRTLATRISARIEQGHWQCLLERKELDAIVTESYEILRSVSYMSACTFFLCAVFSSLMCCTGPPTPDVLKRLFLGRLRRIALPTTKELAKLLIQFDELQDRSKDAFVSYTCKSRWFERSDVHSYLICPSCKNGLDLTNKCRDCEAEYSRIDGMLFLLSPELDHIRLTYSPAFSATVATELL